MQLKPLLKGRLLSATHPVWATGGDDPAEEMATYLASAPI
jgi:D-serine dehydratase